MTSCCYVEIDGYDSPKVWSQKIVRARKTHRCAECGESILPGEQYEDYRGLYDARWERHRTCLGCVSCRDAFACGWIFTAFWADFFESTQGDIDLADLDKLSVAGRAKFSDQLAEYMGLFDEEAEG